MELVELQQTLRKFAADRSWQEFHTPKNLSMALMVEAAELAEIFQWQTPQESIETRLNPQVQMHTGEELADVLLYLLQLADHTGVDLDLAVADKLLKNAKKYPLPGAQEVSAPEEQKAAQTHVLVDWENVQPKDADIRSLVPDVTNVWIFHGPNQKRGDEDQTSFGTALTLVPISRPGKNSLDFHLSYYVGYISSRNPNARFVVISNDKGYEPMLEHAKVLGFAASQVGFGKPRVVTKKGPAKKAATKKTVLTKKSAKSTQDSVASKPVKVTKALVKKTVPKKTSGVHSRQAAKTPAVSKSSNIPVAAKQKAPTATKTKNGGDKLTSSAKKAELRTEEEMAYEHVLSSLRKSKNKPTRKARLYGAVKSLMGEVGATAAAVERVVKRLTAEGYLAIDDGGAVTKTP